MYYQIQPICLLEKMERNRKIKTIIAFVLTLTIMTLSIPMGVYAMESQSGSSTVTYTVDDYFFIAIPETISVGTEASVCAYEANIAPGKSIYVRIEGLESNDAIKLYNDVDETKTINVYFKDGNGERYTSSNNLVAVFGSNQNGFVQTATFNTETDANPMEVPAGTYTGQVYFTMICE